MVSLYDSGIYLVNGTEIVPESESGKVKKLTGKDADQASARKGTIAYSILEAHNTSGDMEHLKLRFDSMASHDITFVGIVQTAKASGMEKFPIPYVLTNCHSFTKIQEYVYLSPPCLTKINRSIITYLDRNWRCNFGKY